MKRGDIWTVSGGKVSRVMVDKITTLPKSKVGARLGNFDDEDVIRLNQAILVFLGLAASPRSKPES